MTNRKKIALIFGTRPEAIKMGPVWSALQEKTEEFETLAITTAQHRDMLDQVLHLFGISPDYDLNTMTPGQSLTDLVVHIFPKIFRILDEERPDLILVHGDTSTTFLSALAGFYLRIPIGHVEAGLRTYKKYSPYPEETNRRLTAILADWHFAPTAESRQNLIQENIPPSDIFVTGNTVIDALLEITRSTRDMTPPVLGTIRPENRIILVTTHRRENIGEPLGSICRALLRLAHDFPDVEFIISVHPNPKVREVIASYLSGITRIHLREPLDYSAFIQLLNHSFLVLSDSGGIQEEAPALGKPVLVLRETTERPEAIRAGTAILTGTEEETVYQTTANLLRNKTAYDRMSKAHNPFGDGNAAKRIVEYIRWRMGLTPNPPLPFTHIMN